MNFGRKHRVFDLMPPLFYSLLMHLICMCVENAYPWGAGDWTLTLPAGPARTFSMEVENPHGLLVYQGLDQTLDLTPGATTTLQFHLTPIETIIPLGTFSQLHPSQPTAIVINDATGPMQGLRLDIPADALAHRVTIVVDELYNPALIPPPISQASAIIGLGPSATRFSRPGTLTVPYDTTLALSLGILETHLQVSRFNSREQTWSPLRHQHINLQAHHITAEIDTLGLYALTVGTQPTSTAQPITVAAASLKRPRYQTAIPTSTTPPAVTSIQQPQAVGSHREPRRLPPQPASQAVKTATWQAPGHPRQPTLALPPPRSALALQPRSTTDVVAVAPKPEQPHHPSPLQPENRWSNYQLQMQVRSNLPGKIGIIFRHQDEQNYYQFIWDLRYHKAQLIKRHNGYVTLLAQHVFPYDPWQSYQVEITAVANTLQTIINGQRLFAVTDSDVPQGRVALNCEYDQSACFGDIRINDMTTQVSQARPKSQRNF